MKHIGVRSFLVCFCACLTAAILFFSATGVWGSVDLPETQLQLPEEVPVPESAKLVCVEEEKFFLILSSGKETFIICVDGEGNVLDSVKSAAQEAYTDVLLDGETLRLVSPQFVESSASRSYTKIFSYQMKGETLQSGSVLQLRSVFCGTPGTLVKAENGSQFFALGQYSPSSLFVFNSQGVQLKEISTSRGEYEGLLLCGNTMFAAYSEEASRMGVWDTGEGVPEEDFPLEESDVPVFPAYSLGDGWIGDANGDVFSLGEEGKSLRFEFAAGGDSACAAAMGSEVVFRTEMSSAVKFIHGEETAQYSFSDGELLSLCASGDRFVVLVKMGDHLVLSDLENYRKEDPNPPESFPESVPESSLEPEEFWIESTFPIDREKAVLILPRPMNYSQLMECLTLLCPCELQAYRPDGSLFLSGNAATGGLLELTDGDSVVDRLNLVVLGDLNSSGTLTDTDEELLYGALNGELELSDLAFIAADFDGNGALETIDLLLLKKHRLGAGE